MQVVSSGFHYEGSNFIRRAKAVDVECAGMILSRANENEHWETSDTRGGYVGNSFPGIFFEHIQMHLLAGS